MRAGQLFGLPLLLTCFVLTAGEAKPKPEDTSPAGKAPASTLDDSGLQFGPDIAKALTQARKPGATEHTVALAGPGLPSKEFETFTPAEPWKVLPVAKEVTGAQTSVQLLAALPAYLAKHKPEVVILFGELTGSRKSTQYEATDWEDICRVCQRFGALPIVCVAPAGPLDDLRAMGSQAAGNVRVPVFELKTPSTVNKRLSQLLQLLDKHVYARVALDEPVKAAPKPGSVDE